MTGFQPDTYSPDTYGPHTYGEAFADVYTSWYGDITDADATASFVAARSRPGPILELGCGDGRLAEPIAARGHTVIGVDASPAMLERCTARSPADALPGRVLPIRADLAHLPVGGPVGGALCAFNTLFNLPSPERQLALLRSVASVLVPGAVLVIEAITGSGLDDANGQSVGVSRMTVDRLVLSATIVDVSTQTIRGQHVDISEAGITLRPWQLRWTTPEQLDAMATEAGLTLAERYADWDESPVGPDSDRHVSVYRRP